MNKTNQRARRRLATAGQPATPLERMKENLLQCVRGAGKVLLEYFGAVTNPRQKENPSSVVCDADLASEKYILGRIESRFPDHNIITEESGRCWRSSEYTWVIDPLDGTSNFVAAIPWFGVQIGVLRGKKPVLAAMYLPTEDALYFAQAGHGAYRNDQPVRVTSEKDLQKLLCTFGFDPEPGKRNRKRIKLLFRLSGAVRNTRTTNSLVDFCYTIDGRFGGCVNLKTKIWDIVPVSLILPEAGGRFTDLAGKAISFELGATAGDRDYPVLGAARQLHSRLVALTQVGKR